jgi:hypothetical protein
MAERLKNDLCCEAIDCDNANGKNVLATLIFNGDESACDDADYSNFVASLN